MSFDNSNRHADVMAHDAHARVYELAESLRVAFDRLGFITPEPAHRSFTPHMTIWKAFKDRNLMRSLNSMRDPEDTVQDELGRVVAAQHPPTAVDFPSRIDLLCMRERDEDGAFLAGISSRIDSHTYELLVLSSGYYRSYARQQLQ